MSTPTVGEGSHERYARRIRRAVRDVVKYIPRGNTIPEESWKSRHRNITLFMLAHIPFLLALGTYTGTEPYVTGATFTAVPTEYVGLGLGIVVGLGLLAQVPAFPRRVRTAIVSVGLVTCSALLVYFSGGFIEAHFHFFVVVGVIAVYEDWMPFVVSILYVAIQHGAFGMSNPGAVYNHPAAVANPMGWGIVHAVFVLGLSAALMTNWVSIERSREQTREQLQNVRDSEEARAEVERLNERLVVRADELATAMDAVSNGDFTAEAPNEADIVAIAEINDAFDEMRHELSSTVLDIRAFASTVEGTTQSVYDDAEELERDQEALARDVRGFATDVREQASDLETTTDELTSLSATIEEIAANADEVAREASTAADSSESGSRTAAEAVEAIEHVEGTVGDLADLVRSLDTRMNDVADSTELIEDIADQTNVLALNANIEAARASDGSEGFAVVAEEVKSLADETQRHSATIGETVEATVEDVERIQRAMSETKARIETGKTTMTEAGDAFSGLTETVEGVDASVETVAVATDDGARTTEEVVNAIERVAERARAIADESESLADRADESAATISKIRSRLENLSAQTESLKTRLDSFECGTVERDGSAESGRSEENSRSAGGSRSVSDDAAHGVDERVASRPSR
ncbi:methyl-accepting chemotaxis protein [Halogeometricum limi]|uniref:Methyl-accepting chemotaxis protein n=1 Tax=Halogeometricum limi TaxID=555875 RepID=A0A1I6IB21_9EURY|nr:methyl-accepting chemotaxis protein [Halogeometricum limi]SFR63580.1 Methyl-accepting chemotaxis protein [Halogeometricum limi]